MTPDQVLVAGQGSAKSGVFHLPDADDPERPDCRHGEDDDRHYWRVDRDRVPDDYWLCRYCDPDREVDHHNPRHGHRQKLLAMDPDEIGKEGSA